MYLDILYKEKNNPAIFSYKRHAPTPLNIRLPSILPDSDNSKTKYLLHTNVQFVHVIWKGYAEKLGFVFALLQSFVSLYHILKMSSAWNDPNKLLQLLVKFWLNRPDKGIFIVKGALGGKWCKVHVHTIIHIPYIYFNINRQA